LLFDGELLYVHTNYKNSLYQLKQGDAVIFSTVPLGKETWQPVQFTTLEVYEEENRIFQGTNHGNEYVESEENMKFLYSIFSDL
jgi:glutamine amidotransferase